MGTLTQKQVDRDKILRSLAIQPGQALRDWKRLSQGERLVVVTYMTAYYDVEFANHFMEEANHRSRPELTITITNNPEWVQSPFKGKPPSEWKFRGMVGDMKVYVHPSGDELWLIPSPKAIDPPGVGTPPVVRGTPPLHPDIVDARAWADNLEARRKALAPLAQKIWDARDKNGDLPFEGPLVDQYYALLNKYEEDLRSVLTDESKNWGEGLTDNEQRLLQIEIERLKELTNPPPGISEDLWIWGGW
jgi:hypothetical protein